MTDLSASEPGAWGPVVAGGTRFGRLRRVGIALTVVMAVAIAAVGVTGIALYRTADANLTRIPVGGLDGKDQGTALNVLVVGSDSREGLTTQEQRDLRLGSFDGQRSDTVILVSVTPDRQGASLVSFPRDLLVYDADGDMHKLTETFVGGPESLIDVIGDNFGVPVHHYAEVSVLGFMGVVEVLGDVEICLDDRLYDRKSGAAFDAGCHDLSPEQALSYVRSRAGVRSDFERIERQQTFLKAMLDKMVSTGTLTDVPKLFGVIEAAADNVTTDDALGLSAMRTLAEELRGLVGAGMPMTVVPGYTQRVSGKDFVIAYGPGARALFSSIREGEPLASRGSDDERADTRVAVWTGGRGTEADIVVNTLSYAGFDARGHGSGDVDAGTTTTVYVVPGFEEQAQWVGAMLGAPVQTLPVDAAAPDDVDVIVSVGDDASS